MPNRLARETSPYLRQHADNPVDWWPWSDEALAAARAANKPILLSIGYAACHWCHVMAHESFEDEATARVMNALYVNIKVDREERPDIDKVYQLAHQALARRGGGWPLTVFLTPQDLMPFFAGTYFPKAPRYGMPAFVQVIEGVRAWFDSKPDEVRAQNDALAQFLADHARGGAHAAALDDAPIRNALERIAAAFDRENGGHVGGPKFPHAGEIELLLRHARDESISTPAPRAMARLTLERMALRGLDDHLGGGFFRYCVDAQWEIPHFEKMLYDNAQLLPLYATAAVVLDDPGFARPADACAAWVAREMIAPHGGFFSSLDADSEGEEGRYYVWERDEVRALLDDDEFAIVEMRYGLDRPPNFEGKAWHLVVSATFEEIGARTSLEPAEARRRLGNAIRKLLVVRDQRVRPGLDDKILTAWNALMIAGAARAARWNDDRPAAGRSGARARFPARERLARWSSLRVPRRRHRKICGLSRRPRVPARRAARDAAGALERTRSRLRDRDRRHAARALRRRRARRLLLHGARCRAAAAASEAVHRTNRCRPATASPRARCCGSVTSSARRAISTRPNARCAPAGRR